MRWGKSVYLLLVSIFLLSGCAFLKSVNHEMKDTHEDAFFVKELQNDLSRLCFNSEGKGRVKVMDQKYLFSFESLHVPAEGLWKLAINLPVAGEEMLVFKYSDVEEGKLKLGGSFYQRLKINKNKDWKLIFKLLGRFMLWMDKNRKGDMSAKCVRQNKTLKGECTFTDESPIFFDLKDNLTLIANRMQKVFSLKTQDETSEGYFQKMSFGLRKKHDFGPRNMQFQLDLFLDSCDEPLKF